MPHLLLEYSDNIVESDFLKLFQHCHALLVSHLPTQHIYCIGDGKPQQGFVSVVIKIMPGRSKETLKLVSEELMKIFKTHFSASLAKLNCQITLEIIEISPFYSKL